MSDVLISSTKVQQKNDIRKKIGKKKHLGFEFMIYHGTDEEWTK